MRHTRAAIRSIRQGYKKSVRYRLTLFFILAILPLILVSLYSIGKSQRILEEQSGEQTRAAMASSLAYIDQFMSSMNHLSLLISNDAELNELLHPDADPSQQIIDAQQILKRLKNFLLAEKSISDLWILDADMGMVLSVKDGGKRIDYKDRDWYRLTIENAGGPALLSNRNAKMPEQPGDYDPLDLPDSMTITRGMSANSLRPSPNALGVTMDLSTFVDFAKELLKGNNASMYLMNANQELIVSSNGDSSIPYDIPDNDQAYFERRDAELGRSMFVTKVRSDESGWSMVLAQPKSNLTEKSSLLQRFTYGVIGISCLLALSIAWIVYTGISAPLRNLLSGIRELARGNLKVQLKHDRIDEFGALTESFNMMAEQQKRYVDDIFEHQVEKTRTELKFLQSQINPHFLYNTLDSIHASAVNYDAEEICEMVLCLSSFFRLSLNKGRESFTLAETVEHLGYYIRIQELRFTDHFQSQLDIPDDCKDLYVLKLILQPLVENAIIHGLEKSPPGGKLIVSAWRTESLLWLSVYNSGRLIEEEQLKRIQEAIAEITTAYLEKYKPSPDYFGMLNVLCRLKLYYGDEAGMRIESNEKERTKVTIWLPLDACLGPAPHK